MIVGLLIGMAIGSVLGFVLGVGLVAIALAGRSEED